MTALLLIILGGLCAVAYGIVTILDVMRRDAGTQRMQEIAAAIAEGAQAYLRRQYTTIGLVGVVLFVLLAVFLGLKVAIGFLIGLPGALIYAATGLGQPGLPPMSLGYVNLYLAAIIIPLSTWMAVYGVRLAHSIDRRRLRMAFGIFLLLTSLRMWVDLLSGVR